MQGIVQKKEFTKNGAPKFQISGTWYFLARSATPQEFPSGTSIEFEWEEFGEDRGRGKPRAIKTWRPAPSSISGNSSHGSSTVTEVDVLRSVSNIVGSACAAGTVKDPVELEKWFVAAWSGLLRKKTEQRVEDKPEFDDDLPF